MQETWVQSLGWEDLLEKEMATHSSILAWKIPWTEEPGRLQKNQTQMSDFTFTFTFMAESEEELKSLLMKVKEESEKSRLKLYIQRTKIIASSLIISWQIDWEKNGNSDRF